MAQPSEHGELQRIGRERIAPVPQHRSAWLDSEQQFRALADAAPVMIWMSGPNKEGIYFNQTWLTFTGRALADQVGEGWLESVHPDDRQRLHEICTEAFRNRQPFTTEFRLRRADGEFRWLLDTGTPRFSPDGAIAGFIGSCVDITDRKRAEDIRERLAAIVETSGDAIISKSLDGTIQSWNAAAQRLFGYTAAEAVGRSILLIIPPERHDEEASILERLRRGERIEHYETVRVTKDGRRVDISLTISPLRDGEGRVVAASKIARDITDQKRAEQALRESQERFTRFMRHLPGLAWIKDHEGRYVYANDAALAAFQVSPETLYGRTDEDVFPPDVAATFRANDRRALASETGVQVVETLEHEDGVLHHSMVSKFPIPGPDGQATLVGGAAFDITERRQAEEALRQGEARKEAMFQAALDCIITIDHEGKIVEFNAAAEATFGYRLEDVLGREMAELIVPPRLRDQHRRAMARYHATGEGAILDRRIEMPALRADGTEFPVELAVTRIPIDGPPLFTAFLRDITERHRAEAELTAKEAELKLIAETTPLMLTRCSRDLRYRFANRAAAALFGLSPAEMVGKPIVDIMGEENFAIIKPRVEQVLRGEAVEYETQIAYRGDGPRWVRVNYIPERDERGDVKGWIASIVDITARKEAEAAFRASESRFRTLTMNAPAAIFIKDIEGRYTLANELASRVLGRDDITGLTDYELMPADLADTLRKHDLMVIQRGEILESEEAVEGDGVRREFLSVKFPLFDAQGKATDVCGVAIDVTDRKRVEEALRASERSLKFLAEASKSLSLLVDYKSTLQRVAQLAVPDFADWCAVDLLDSEGSLERLAVAHVDPAKVALADEVHRRFPPDISAPRGAARVLRTGEPEFVTDISDDMLVAAARDEEHLRILRDLDPKSYMCVPLSAKGTTLGAISFVMAESGRRYRADDLALAEDLAHRAAIAIENARLYEEVREDDRRKDEFLAMLSHELRNPLTPIRSGLDVLAMEPHGHDQTIKLMQQQVEHLVRLVDDLLDVSRIVQGKIELRRQPVTLASVVERSVAAMRPAIESRRQRLSRTLPENEVWLHADPARLSQVVENLLNNSSKYSDPGGLIELAAQRLDGEVVLRVRDDGIGIEPDLLPKVFELFSQSARTLDRAEGGLGIGLTLVHNLVRMHGGAISAHSEGVGRGSEFVVRLPAQCEALPEAVRETRPSAPAPGRRILVVDDKVDAAHMLVLLLSKLGPHEVETAYDGEGALRRVGDFCPEIVLLDIGLPRMDGYQVAQTIRENADFDHVLLVALTGYGQISDRRKSREAGFDEHLVKPPALEEIERLLVHPKLSIGTQPPAAPRPAAARNRRFSPPHSPKPAARTETLDDRARAEVRHELGNHAHVVGLAAALLEGARDASDHESVRQTLKKLEGEMQKLIQSLRADQP